MQFPISGQESANGLGLGDLVNRSGRTGNAMNNFDRLLER